jgi:hypothetical protein
LYVFERKFLPNANYLMDLADLCAEYLDKKNATTVAAAVGDENGR